MKRLTRQLALLLVMLFLSSMLFGCGGAEETVTTNDNKSPLEDPQDSEIITVKNNDRTIEFDRVPERAVSLNQHVTEIMLALHLEDHMVGTAYLDDEILPEFKEAYESIPVLSDQYPSRETFLDVEPDFAYAGWSSAFNDDAVGTIESLEQFDINAYLHESSTTLAPTIDDIFQDIRNIAKIFRVESRGEELIEELTHDIEVIQERIGEVEEPLRVFVYDSGEDAPFTATQNFMSELIRLAGGENIFGHIEKMWANVSWEEVVEHNPEVIVIIDYGNTSVEQKKNLLLQKSALSDVEAIQKQRFVVLPLSAASEGIRIPLAVETLATSFYPEKFE